MIRVLIVDDSALMRKFLAGLFEAEEGFMVATARDGADALSRIGSFNPDVVTLDVEMPTMDGLACLDRIMVEHPCPVVMVSAVTEQGADATMEALQMGAVDFVAKPTGTISLHREEFGPLIKERVRQAAGIRIRRSARLADRLRFNAGATRQPSEGRVAPALSHSGDHRLVLVGASTGGPPALDALLSGLPSEFRWPILIAQHMPRTFTASFARRLDSLCKLPVREVNAPTAIEDGCVYVGRGDADMMVARRGDQLIAIPVPSSAQHLWHPSVDRLVMSAMQHMGPHQLVGILLTGMGNDGAAAMAELRKAGGYTIAEAEESAVVWGMPGELVRLNGASDIVALPHMAERLLEIGPWR
ncbi:chemotaxis-specific protein-glutamate methyltransferase CheB [Aestuariivirga sp.]|uniref:chemotaxis-specific protein-glutamate methyltransferase CheB n=1 Tax=Aestuariivirga sp. TaxID=2650926 RepID=UPI003BA99171